MSRNYDDMTVEELEQELREAFFYPDQIDDQLSRELELIREALERKRPTAFLHTPEEAWEIFLADNAGELAPFLSPQAETNVPARKTRAARTSKVAPLLRRTLIAAAVLVLLAGAALAAGPRLWAWVPGWNGAAGRYEPVPEEIAGKPIQAALAGLGITEPVYPARLPEGFVLTESHVSEDPLVLMEQYAKGDRLFSVTVTPVKGFRNAVYPAEGAVPRESGADKAVHYLFKNGDTIIAVRYTESYATTVSGNISLEEIETIMDSFGTPRKGGGST